MVVEERKDPMGKLKHGGERLPQVPSARAQEDSDRSVRWTVDKGAFSLELGRITRGVGKRRTTLDLTSFAQTFLPPQF